MKNNNFIESEIINQLISHFNHTLNLNNLVDFQIEFVDDMPLDKNGKFKLITSEINSQSK